MGTEDANAVEVAEGEVTTELLGGIFFKFRLDPPLSDLATLA